MTGISEPANVSGYNLLNLYALSSHFVSALFKDREDGVWICFHQNGVNYYSPFRPFNVYYP